MKVKTKKKKMESKHYLLVSVLICVLILLIAFVWFQSVLRENINQTNYEIMQETARQQVLSFETKMQGQLSQLQLYARSFANVDMNDYNKVKELLNVTEGAGSFQTISVANTTGKLVNNHNTSAGNIMKKQYFQEALAGNAAIGIDDSAEGEGLLELYFAVPIYQGKTIIGVLVGSEQQSKVTEAVMTDSFRGTGATFIISQEGDILLQSDNGADMIGNAANYLSYLKDSKAKDVDNMPARMENDLTTDNTEVYRSRIKGTEYIIIRKPVAFGNWSLILQVNASFVNSQSTQIIIYVLKLSLLVLISMLVIVAALFQLQRNSNHLKNKAERDLLTNLLNKKTFEYMVGDALANHSENESGALWIIDLDNFKGINDTMGHMVGDQVISHVADKMKEAFREQDYLGRIGGDEFAAYITFQYKLDSKERYAIIQSKAEYLRRMIGTIAGEISQDIKVSCSIGIAMSPEHGTSYETLYQNADQALYQSKEGGKDKYVIRNYSEPS